MSIVLAHLDALLGLDQEAAGLTFVQISLRGVVVFAAALADRPLRRPQVLSQKTAFDAVLGFILASMLARAVKRRRGISSRRSGAASCWPSCTGSWRTGRSGRMPSAS